MLNKRKLADQNEKNLERRILIYVPTVYIYPLPPIHLITEYLY